MIYKEIIGDLFEQSEDYYLAHCISADFALGAGIAVEFVKRFDMRNKLKSKNPDFVNRYHNCGPICILDDESRVFNLITKEMCYHKPTYNSLKKSLEHMRLLAEYYNITKIAIPQIGCGIDGLKWNKVSEIIKQTFDDSNIEILVCIWR